RESAVGYLPTKESLDLTGLDIPESNLKKILSVDRDEWCEETKAMEDFYKLFGERLPSELKQELAELSERLTAASV
ncbi:MAG TPA: phosphoenolpyruvate carboxykinase domain-containing protein, partial [Ignavibacteriaceae bacterium]